MKPRLHGSRKKAVRCIPVRAFPVHPESGVPEFSGGPASDIHAGGTPGEDPAYHRFHRVKGGFLKASVRRQGGQSLLAMEFCDVDGNVVYRWETIQSLRRKP